MSRYAEKFAATTAAYKVDVSKHEAAKVSMEFPPNTVSSCLLTAKKAYFNVTKVPTVVVYKDGKEVKKAEGVDQAGMEEVASILS